ncbi:NADP-dependent phosphogluconate dehydrogenase [Roseivirga pacifica]|uniref:NADP-dependent phosphogluconate dehydrogenase n=1 Tax=Roseivirga pacifica TaxID=1267423 RepID=UPI002095A5BA|nr:NADP-dependent phosphogluconate dehydrogenase [Roseivirga pacifica]MCO6360814.1 NADP-dependent phosphogluconate dehydrogenase [Roseivirga pacifica]MCO6368703.1 NADP-dependent phosphogluconate dehydrogenase [Roseivirga pacifica]MCO6372846.1 NADP-dependent phosphogluconate dehydrogenase [Roseivirga pacifica]MCO6376905.1 NADP-dependent phosphogluconate dehydrogenase [Roseivirga pacifica]MCO6377817.1 NADP-dependent phosphogluconate dehydrogenase [Roseivirga pacifica]
MSDIAYDFGLVGLGVMGRNFILNVADNGFSAIGLDLDKDKVDSLISEGGDRVVTATQSKEEFVKKLATPRKIMLLVPAGKAVDAVIADLKPLLSEGDIIIDGGNSFFTDTDRRFTELAADKIHFFGSGVSGGAKGARRGPSIMPGGDKAAYEHIKPIFEAASAKVNGEPCVAHLGNGSAGNYVKMVHNGIEYGLMQLISEVYDLMKRGLGHSNEQLQKTFDSWNKSELQSFLVEITAEIFQQKDDLTDADLVDMILDKAKQKGTGKWTSQNAMDLGIPIPSIDVAVSMREISALKSDREKAQAIYGEHSNGEATIDAEDVKKALLFAFITTYAQGLNQLVEASKEYEYGLDLETIAKIWRGGCIIRAALLEDFRKVFTRQPELSNILLDQEIAEMVKPLIESTTKVVNYSLSQGIPLPAVSASLNYFLAFKSGKLPLNLIQAQRDHFGSHTYERIDREGIFHTEW